MKLHNILILCSLIPLAACMNTSPVRDRARFFILVPSAGSVEMVPNSPSIGIRDVELPGYLRSSKIALRQSGAQIVYRSFELWSESLADSASRTLAERLAARIGREHVDAFPWTNGVTRDVELRVQFDHFEGTTDGAIAVSGRYIITHPSNKTDEPVVVAFDYQGKWTRDDYSSLAKALGDQLDRLAAEILARVATK